MAPFFSRSRTTSQAARADTPSLVLDDAPPPPPPPDPHAFLPLHIAPPPRSSSASVSVAAFPASPSGGAITGPSTPPPQYGYLSYRPGTTLGLAQAAALADVLCAELTARGAPSTPFIFSALALDVSRAKINRLIDAFLGTCVIGIGKEKEDREKRWREEVRFGAGVHEMGFVLRWGMARVRRANGERGLLSLSYYDEWARNEEGASRSLSLYCFPLTVIVHSPALPSNAHSCPPTSTTASPALPPARPPYPLIPRCCPFREIGTYATELGTAVRTIGIRPRKGRSRV